MVTLLQDGSIYWQGILHPLAVLYLNHHGSDLSFQPLLVSGLLNYLNLQAMTREPNSGLHQPKKLI
jgi:hypothetical protein